MNPSIARKLRENRIVRTFAYPFEQLHRKLRLRMYQGGEDSLYMKSLKGIHKGESCFIIGNGPSLNVEDLNKLFAARTVTFAANRIYQIYQKTQWRPTYYICIDENVLDAKMEEIKQSGSYPKFVDYTAKKYGRKPEDNIHYLCNSANMTIDMRKWKCQGPSPDFSKSYIKAGTVAVNAIELAIYLGFNTIYLLGIDNNYMHKRGPDGTVYIDPTVEKSYFSGGEPDASLGVTIQEADTTENYEITKHFAESRGVRIYNATRGGKLEVFERVDFDSLFA